MGAYDYMPMPQRISRDEVLKVANLACLNLDDDELELFTRQLGDVLDEAAALQGLDLDGVEPTSRPIELINVFRADEPAPSLDRTEVLACAPEVEDGRFRVPSILGEEP